MRGPRVAKSNGSAALGCEHQDSPIAVYRDEQGQRIARCLKCGAISQPQQDALSARAVLTMREQKK
jgi:hypothetical protein